MNSRTFTTKPVNGFVLDLINEVERRAKENSKESAEIAERKSKELKEKIGL